jgi:putative tryptophan/tyrosine transport system substrate-binding protein
MSKKLCSFILIFFLLIQFSCSDSKRTGIPTVGFIDLLTDETLNQAKRGFFTALKDQGFDPMQNTLKIIYRNAQNDQPALIQACDYLIAQSPDLIATNPTLSTITVVQKQKTIPVFMMVSPSPELMNLTDDSGKGPPNLFGTYETLEYIDTAIMLIRQLKPDAKKVGAIYNQSEPQSVEALKRIEKICRENGLELVSQAANNSSETQLIVQSLLGKNIDVFFALPDNTVFSSMEVIVKSCDDAKVPVFTSEEGLVKRGAVAAFGADMYQWGYQSGTQAASYLKSGSTTGLKPEPVSVRRKVYNKEKAAFFNIVTDSTFTAVQ